jgi:hypothetical protein
VGRAPHARSTSRFSEAIVKTVASGRIYLESENSRATNPFQEFFRSEAAGGALLLVCACAALALANSRWADVYLRVRLAMKALVRPVASTNAPTTSPPALIPKARVAVAPGTSSVA